MATFLHGGDLGDLVYALPVIRQLGGGTLYLTPRKFGREPITPARYEFIKPLCEAQSYIDKCEMHHGQQITHDFLDFRDGFVREQTLTEIQRRHVSPFVRPDVVTPWLVKGEQRPHGRVVIARSPRYHNPEWYSIWPLALALQPDPVFIGLREEHAEFQKHFGKIEYHPVDNAKQVSDIISGSSLFIGNQSFPFSVAEGLKHSSVLEVFPRAADCIFDRDNVYHVWEKSEWPFRTDWTLMIALQVYPGDYAEAVELAGLIAMNEPEPRKDVEVAVCVRHDVTEAQARALAGIFIPKFKTHILRSKRSGEGWPDGCNDLWQASMVELGKMARMGATRAEAVFTFEPDVVFLRKDWLNVLRAVWVKADVAGKIAAGDIHDIGGPDGVHMNGNMLIEIHATKNHGPLQTSSGPWDQSHKRYFRENGMDTNQILNIYKNTTLTEADIFGVRKNGELPAILHGVKTKAGRNAVKAKIIEGKL